MQTKSISPQKSLVYFLVLLFLLSVTACGNQSDKSQSASEEAYETKSESPAIRDESTSESNMPTEQARRKSATDTTYGVSRSNLAQTGRKFIRTAEMRFKVENVQRATFYVEDLAAKYQGFITEGSLKSYEQQSYQTPYRNDSLIVSKVFTVENEITIRVPNAQMDSLLRDLSKKVLYLDYQNIKAEDVSLSLLQNELKDSRYKTAENRYIKAIDEDKNKRLESTTQAEDRLLDRQNEQDNNAIQKLNTEDKVAFSTVKLYLYQNQQAYKETIPNYERIYAYQPSLGIRLYDALAMSFRFLENILLFFVSFWFLPVGILLAFGLYKAYRKGRKAA